MFDVEVGCSDPGGCGCEERGGEFRFSWMGELLVVYGW